MFFTIFQSLCKEHGKSPTGVGAEIGISKTTISYWKNKQDVIPKQDVLLKISNYFDVSVDYLLGNSDQKNKSTVENDGLDEENIKIALFGGDAKHISDAVWNDVKDFARKVAEIERRKKEYDGK